MARIVFVNGAQVIERFDDGTMVAPGVVTMLEQRDGAVRQAGETIEVMREGFRKDKDGNVVAVEEFVAYRGTRMIPWGERLRDDEIGMEFDYPVRLAKGA